MLDVLGAGPDQFRRLAERLVEGQLLEHRYHVAHRVEHAAAGQPVDDAARRQHHRTCSHQPAGLMHRHRRAGAEGAGLVAGTGDRTAPAQSADQHRACSVGRVNCSTDAKNASISKCRTQRSMRLFCGHRGAMPVRPWRSRRAPRRRSPPRRRAHRTRSWWPAPPRRSGRRPRPVRLAAGTDITTVIRSLTSKPLDCAGPAVRGCGPWPSPRPPVPG